MSCRYGLGRNCRSRTAESRSPRRESLQLGDGRRAVANNEDSDSPLEAQPMSDPSKPARRAFDAVGLTCCAVGLLLTYSLCARSGGEPFAPPAGRGWATAPDQVRYRLFEALGLSAYGFAGAWFALAAFRWRRPSWLGLMRRSAGWALLIVVTAIGLDRFGSPRLGGPLIGSGGAVGAAGAVWLEQRLPVPFVIAPLAAGLALGLLLAAPLAVRLIWKFAVIVVRMAFFAVEWALLRLSDLFAAIALALHRLARPIGSRLHPNRSVPAMTIRSAKGLPAIPIHHHLEAAAVAPTPGRAPEPFIPIHAPVDTTVPERPYDLPPLDLLDDPVPLQIENQDQKLCEVAAQLEKACADFNLVVKVVGIHTGPVITQYEISLDTGLRVSKITALADDLALHLKVPSVRIVAPIPGKNAVGIEVPNDHRAMVRMKELATAGHARIAKSKLPLLLGKDSEGRPLVHDLADMPHLLIAGRTGTGKSVCLNSIILSLLLTRRPDECKLIMIDPKQVELAEYGRLPHLMHPVVTDNKKAEAILSWGVDKMEERYEILRRARVRNIASYNELPYEEILRRVKPVDEDEQTRVPPRMPYIVIVVDEVGDLMMAMKKEVEGHIIRLAQKSRAAGIHLILTTQRPTVDVITGLIKSNLPARICFQVADRSNSRVVLDEMGAEKLLGKGDMLFLQPNTSQIIRAQGAFASDDEIHRIVGKLEVENPTYDSELLGLRDREMQGKGGMMEAIRKRDDLYEEAIEIVIREGRGSVSLLQRALGIGYGRAARLVDFMAEDGVVGHYNGAQAREVLFTMEQWEAMRGGADALAESA
jgi:DNA segregation ATPase FtsK/SpoIIIE, S-DNA-T family